MEKCINGLQELNQRREKARWWGENSVIIGCLHGDEKSGDGNLRWERARTSGIPHRGRCWVELSFGWVLASKNDHAIKMIQSGDFGHGQGNICYTYPCFHYASDCTQHSPLLLFSSTSSFIASISHTENSLGIDKCAEPKPLNGHRR